MRQLTAGLLLSMTLLACTTTKDDPCAASPCQNGGTCVPDGSVAVCVCAAGYEGATCAMFLELEGLAVRCRASAEPQPLRPLVRVE